MNEENELDRFPTRPVCTSEPNDNFSSGAMLTDTAGRNVTQVSSPLTEDGAKNSKSAKQRKILVAMIMVLIVTIIVIAVALTFLLRSHEPASSHSAGASQSKDQNPNSSVAEIYNQVLDDISSYTFDAVVHPPESEEIPDEGTYEYTLADATADGIPEMLVRTPQAAGIYAVRVFSADVQAQKVIAPEKTVPFGIYVNGGSSGDQLYGSSAGQYLLHELFMRGSGETWTSTITITDGALVEEEDKWHYVVNQPPQDLLAQRYELTFSSSDDRTLLDELASVTPEEWADQQAHAPEQTSDSDVTQSVPTPEEEQKKATSANPEVNVHQEAVDAARAEGLQVYEGTIRIMNKASLLELQGISDPNPGSGSDDESYAILLLDSTAQITGNHADEDYTDEANLISLGDDYNGTVDQYRSYDGQNVAIAFESFWWPSETSLPLGQPRGQVVKVIK